MDRTANVASFMFHEVTDDPTSSGFQRPGAMAYKHSPQAFARYLDQFATASERPELVTAVELAQRMMRRDLEPAEWTPPDQ